MDINLRRLRAYVVLAEELHFTRAATRLFVAQQSLSRQIAELERDLGTPLLRRTSRSVELTSAGEVFLDAARETLECFDRGVEQTRAAGSSTPGILQVGFIPGAALELTAPIMAEFAATHPEVRIELHESGFADPSAGLRGADIDVAFIRLPSDTSNLTTYRLFGEPCVAGVSRTHRLSGHHRVRVSDLLGETLTIGRTDDQHWRDFWTLATYRDDDAPPRLIETTSQSEEMEVVSTGMACTITPAAIIRYTPHPAIRFIAIEDSPKSVLAVAHRSGPITAVAQAFVDTAQSVRDREQALVDGIERPTLP
ncbi:LysR family transcriptional regulator [Gordonia sp. TBRC 11910]|uniref:LysR family transcriptional regulator n=1 Tax=Gordonia asplenii TaxID=2725283 RepID=A0A848L2Y5_9ACTN|nr:LysR substrate-binding domain-containing protein [Gordonia asplenii]NMO02911.1 LysR family transcriptional regulator [Gordonia asplenii]